MSCLWSTFQKCWQFWGETADTEWGFHSFLLCSFAQLSPMGWNSWHFEEIHPSGTVGWREFWQCMLSKGTGLAVANIVCLPHKVAEAEALSHPWSDDPRLSRVSCLQVFWKLMTDTNISSSYSHSHYCEFNPSKSSTFSVNGQTYTLSCGSRSLSMVLEYDTVTVSDVLTAVEALWFPP